MKKQEELEKFSRFEAAHAEAVWVLKPRREAEANPNWRPSWIEGSVIKPNCAKFSGNNFMRHAEGES
jgi:hypothetical protein